MRYLGFLFVLLVWGWVNSTAIVAQEAQPPTRTAKVLTDGQIKKILIRESIENYPGNCPCPYNHASNGSRCGRRSAYSRAGGYETLCYPKDVTPEMVRAYREQMEQ